MANVIGVGVIGLGGRADCLLGNLLRLSDQVSVRGLVDPAEERRTYFLKKFNKGATTAYADYRPMLADPQISWVIVASPNVYHREHILAAFQAGKHVFGEKPLATTIEDCLAIHAAHKQTKLLFATGFVLRYAPLYRRVRQLLDDRAIGDVVAVNADENIPPDHSGYIMANWRRLTRLSGGHLLEKCCHDLDLLNWFTGSLPARVASFGGCDIFTPAQAHLIEKYPGKRGKSVFQEWERSPGDLDNPFTGEKDIIDNQVCIWECRNGVRVQFQASMNNPIPERRMYFTGTEGNLIAELYRGLVQVRRIGKDEPIETYDVTGDMHGGGDIKIVSELLDTMRHGTEPKCSGEEGLHSAVVALGLDRARVEGRIVDMEPIWRSLGC